MSGVQQRFYTCGSEAPRVISNIKQLTFEEKLVSTADKVSPAALQVVDARTLLLTNLNDDDVRGERDNSLSCV